MASKKIKASKTLLRNKYGLIVELREDSQTNR